MIEAPADQLQRAVEAQHGGEATLAAVEPVHETHNGKTVWEGVVHVFDLVGHPSGSPLDAVRAAIVAEHRAKAAP